MMFLALGAKWGSLAKLDPVGAWEAANRVSLSKDASASAPIPVPQCLRNLRRVIERRCCSEVLKPSPTRMFVCPFIRTEKKTFPAEPGPFDNLAFYSHINYELRCAYANEKLCSGFSRSA